MKAQPFVVTPKDYPQPLHVVGEQVTVLASGAATQGYEIFLQEGPEGSGPPPHAHPWDESFYVTMGEIEFGVEKERLVATAGTLVHIPAGTTHWFRIGEGGGKMLSMTARLGASRMFADIDREIPPDRPEVEKLVGVVARHGVTVSV
ncbi:MAG TPA: cupin domain-containing protein [Gemmatimonadaceae bacterium]|nr:cupin domain-containing protein [Gemmatimonadaceae bacterium]